LLPLQLLSDSPSDAPFAASYYSLNARALRISIEKNKKLHESMVEILSILRRPSSGEMSGVPTLVVPVATHIDGRMKKIVTA
jgi:hypothetical protein